MIDDYLIRVLNSVVSSVLKLSKGGATSLVVYYNHL